MASTAIGLDIGSSAVRAVQIGGGRGRASLDRLGQVLLPPGAVREGEIADADAVVEALRLLWSRYGFKARKVALGVANQQVVVRQVDLPYLPENELRQSLGFQVADLIPIPVDQAILDFHVLEHYETDDGQRFSRLLLVAAQREMINAFVDVARAAKLEPISVDLDAFAVLRALAPESAIDGSEGELLVDVGADVTNIVVHEAGAPRFVRILLLGGQAVTDGLVSALGMAHDEAEDVKARVGLAEPDIVPNAQDETARLINERANRFIEEIRGSLDFYTAQAESVPVRRIVLSGGASQLPNLPQRMSEALRLPVDRGHPMQELKIGKVGVEPEQLVEAEAHLSVPIGLALGVLS